MTGTLISANVPTGITLQSSASNPVSIAASVTVSGGHSGAVYGRSINPPSNPPGWTINNAGSVLGSGTINGIQLGSSGKSIVGSSFINNQSGGRITGATGIATNGYYYNQGGGALYSYPAYIVNQSGASIGGLVNDGISLYGSAIVTNSGVISAPTASAAQAGVMFRQVTTHAAGIAPPGGSVTNNAGGTIVGGSGIVLNNGGRVVNAGTIIGTIGDAVDFAKTSPANQLVVDPGAVFIGKVVGGTGFIELASATSAGTLSGFDGTSITNFSTLEFDAGAKWTVSGNATGLGGGALSSIMGFTANDTIDVTGFAAATSAVSTNQLVLTGGDGTSVTLDIQGHYCPEESERTAGNPMT